MAQVANVRKAFRFSIVVQSPIDQSKLTNWLAQDVTLPDVEIEEAIHGDSNYDVKTAGRLKVGKLIVKKLLLSRNTDTQMFDWLSGAQHPTLGGGLPAVASGTGAGYWKDIEVTEHGEDGSSILNKWVIYDAWPSKIAGLDLSRTKSDNTVEHIEFSCSRMIKL